MSTLPRTDSAYEIEPLGSARFQIKRRLGEGSMGAVYLAFDRERGVGVALKSLRRVDAMSIYHFKREFRALSDVIHPNLVALYDLFQEGDLWYFTMEHVEGVDFLSYVLGVSRHAVLETPRTAPSTAESSAQHSLLREPHAHGLELLFPTPLRDEDRLRDVLIQIAEALLAIHAAGKLHRDLKSDNVLVTQSGRAKVLDFGIVADRVPGIHSTLELGVMGTPAYMSPEQAAGQPVAEATDWYALGVMLYEALTGSVPFDGTYSDVMNQKQHVDPPPPSQVVSGVPPDLDELCVRLLLRDPSARPEGSSVLRALERKRAPSFRPPSAATSSSLPAEPEAPFVGRAEELNALLRHLAATDNGKPVVTFVHGASGIGKTTLVEHLVAVLRQGEKAVVLKGRCYERETVPFKAFDSLVDSLSRYLRRLQSAAAAEVLPRDILALAHLFPALRRVDVVAMARRRGQLPSDRQELRRRAFSALKELLCRLSDRAPLVLFIDDLQWGDVDSAHLIRELIRGPAAPAILFLLTYRSGEASSSPCLKALFEDTGEDDDPEIHQISLAPLSEQESVELAVQLLGPVLPTAASGIGRESLGNPHVVTELVRHVLTRKRDGSPSDGSPSNGSPSDDTQRGLVTFERALMKRVGELTAGARTLLELLSVAGRPLPEESLALVSSFDIDLQQAVTELRGAKLARGVRTHTRRAIEPYHDRIREAVVAAMAPARLELWHKRLASTLEATGSDELEAIVEHLLGAGDSKRAQIYAIRAATQAAEALAFEKAARLFAIAVENQNDGGWGHELLVRWADSLVNAGHGRQAAAVYFDAARAAPEPDAQVLRCKAGLQLLSSGHEQEAFELLSPTFRELGVKIPANFAASLPMLTALRERIGARGLALAVRDGVLGSIELERLDTLLMLALSMAQNDPDRALPLVARCLLATLEAGEPVRAVRGLCLYHDMIDAPLSVLEAGALQGALVAAEALESTLQQPAAQARVLVAQGLDGLRSGQLKPAMRALSRADDLLSTRCPGSSLEVRACRTAMGYLLSSFLQLERLTKIEHWAQEAEEHEDLLAGTRLRLLSSLGLLVADQPESAARVLEQALARYGHERADWTAMLYASAQVMLALYRADHVLCGSAVARYEGFFRSSLAGVPLLCGNVLLWRARASLAASLADGADGTDEQLLLRVEQDARAVAALRLACLEPRIRLVRAGLAARRGDPDTALAMLETVLSERAEQPDLAFYVAAAERGKAELMGAEAGRGLLTKADADLRKLGVQNPVAFFRLLAAGFTRG